MEESKKILDIEKLFFYGVDYCCFFSDNGKKTKSHPLAPIVVEILFCWVSVQEIVTESGTNASKNALCICSKI